IVLHRLSRLCPTCRHSEDDRFPPYDCTKDFEAFVRSKPDFFRFASPEDIPADLKWENGQDLPEIGSPDAVKGGTFRYFVESFPSTFRFVGPDANDSFRYEHWEDVSTPTVARHMNVDGWHSGIAKEWAVSPDRKKVYFRIDPEATDSDGVPIVVDDYFFTFYVMLSPHIQDPWYNDFY